jgi:hypothetical protein
MPTVLPVLLALLAPAAPEAVPTIAERTQGLERHDGFVPFYWDARKGQLLLELVPSDAEFLYGESLATGVGILEVFLDRGQLGDLGLCRWQRVGPRVLLEQRQTRQRSGVADPARTQAIAESFPTAILASLPVAAEDAGRVLVDANELLLRDPGIATVLKQAGQGEFRHDRERSTFHFERSGAFPRNTEIEVVLTYSAESPAREVVQVLPDGRTLTLRAHHSFLALPEPGYAPRELDPRVGFIPVPFKDHTAPFTEPIERALAARWRLEKKDPKAALSEPVAPIVFHLDRGMPEPERSAVREAALWWNHAFEEAGFRNAFVVKDLPEGASLLDVRHSGIEWVARAERGWSVGDTQVDPRTGEILHAVARIDSHRRRTTSRMWRNMRRPGDRACTAGDAPDGGWLATFADPDPSVDEQALVLARLRYLSAHEVGHTLGIAHNWAATTFGWGSVMDYLGPRVEAKHGRLDLSDAYPTDVGSYDRLVIRWGYAPDAEPAARDAMVREALGRGIVYPLESDPRWAEYDWGPDAVAWLRTSQEVRRVVLDRFGPAQLAPGEPLYDLQVRFSLAYLYHRFAIQAAQQLVAGRYQANALAGDGQTPAAWVPAAVQRAALDQLLDALEPRNLDVPDRIVEALVAPPSGFARSREEFPGEAGEAFSPLAAARSLAGMIVGPLLDPRRAARLTLATGPEALSLGAVLRRLSSATWGAPADAAPRAASLRRVTQRVVLDALMDLAARPDATPETRATVVGELSRLRAELKLRRGADRAAEAHLRLAERDVVEFLERPEVRKARPLPPAPPGRPIGESPPPSS